MCSAGEFRHRRGSALGRYENCFWRGRSARVSWRLVIGIERLWCLSLYRRQARWNNVFRWYRRQWRGIGRYLLQNNPAPRVQTGRIALGLDYPVSNLSILYPAHRPAMRVEVLLLSQEYRCGSCINYKHQKVIAWQELHFDAELKQLREYFCAEWITGKVAFVLELDIFDVVELVTEACDGLVDDVKVIIRV